MEELPDEVIFLSFPVKDSIDPEILRAHVGTEVFPFGIIGVGRRLDRVWSHMAEAARHPYPVWPHQVLVLVISLIRVVPVCIPALGRSLVEVRIREKPQAYDAGLITVIRAHSQFFAVGTNGLTARANLHARILLLILEWIGFAVRAALIDPQPPSLWIGAGRFFKTGIIDQAQVLPAFVATESRVDLQQFGVRGDDLQKVQGPGALVDQRIPKVVIARGPHQPGVATLDLVRSQSDAAIHIMEVILIRCREAGGTPARKQGLILHAPRSWLVIPPARVE